MKNKNFFIPTIIMLIILINSYDVFAQSVYMGIDANENSANFDLVVSPPPPPPAEVIIEPQPQTPFYPQPRQVIVVHPQPVPPPQPRYVIVRPQPQPQVVIVRPQPQPRQFVLAEPFTRGRAFGLGVRGVYVIPTEDDGMDLGGFGLNLRFDASPRFGMEFAGDFIFGAGYPQFYNSSGDVVNAYRREASLSMSGIWYINPQHHVVAYLLFGWGLTFAKLGDEYDDLTDEATYLMGGLGVGVEFRIGSHLSINTDIRGILRARVNDRNEQLSYEVGDGSCRTGDNGIECTDWEGGAIWNLGVNYYF